MAFYQNVPDRRPRKVNHAERGAWEEEGSRYRTGKQGEKESGKLSRKDGSRGQEYRGDRDNRNFRYVRDGGYPGKQDGWGNRREQKNDRKREENDRRKETYNRRREETDRRREQNDRQQEFPESRRYTDFEYAPARAEQPEEELSAQEYILTGRNPIREALKNGRDLEKLLVQKGELSGSARAIVQEAKERKVMVQVVEKSRLDEITPQHQGLIAFGSAYQYATVDEMMSTARERGEEPFLILLDGVTDPHNLGAIIRSAECSGAHGVIVPQHRSAGLTPAAVKASAGAVEYMKVARVTNLNRTIEELQRQGVWVYAVTMDGQDYLEVPFEGATALVIGAEGEGISRLTAEKCDMNVSLPMSGHLDSLNASVAAGIMMYRVMASRKAKG